MRHRIKRGRAAARFRARKMGFAVAAALAFGLVAPGVLRATGSATSASLGHAGRGVAMTRAATLRRVALAGA